MIVGFDYKEVWLGQNDQTAYTFDFKIFALSQIFIYIQDNFGNVQAAVRGTDQVWLSSVTFDSIAGGGTVNLVNNLPTNWVITMFPANDAPDQPSDFPNKSSFTLKDIEQALDYLCMDIQRAAFFAQRSVRLFDLDDIDDFNPVLPQNASSYPNAILTVNPTGTGWTFYSSIITLMEQITEAITAAAAIEQILSELAEYQSYTGPFGPIAAGANLNLAGEVTNSSLFTEVDYIARIQRGTTIFTRVNFSIFYRNSTWQIAVGNELFDNNSAGPSNVTFTVNAASGQINAAVANDGGANATIDLLKTYWPVA